MPRLLALQNPTLLSQAISRTSSCRRTMSVEPSLEPLSTTTVSAGGRV
jgi:hypothetical protein